MSTKRVMTTVRVCDICGEKEVYDKCLRCGKDYCSKHAKTELITYPHMVVFKSSDDGQFCKQCHQEILDNPTDKFSILLQSYRTMKSLRTKVESFSKQLDRDEREAEDCINYHRKLLKV